MRSIIQKKGIFNIFVALIIILVVAIVGLLFFIMSAKVNEYWLDSGLLNSTAVGTHAVEQMRDIAPTYTDYAIFLTYIGLLFATIIGAVKTNFSPVLIFFFIILLIGGVLVAGGVVNIYHGFSDLPDVTAYSSQLGLTAFVFSRYTPLIIAVIGAVTLIIMWSKSGGDIQ